MQRAQGATVAKMDEQTTRTARYLDIQALESRMEALLAMEPTEEVAEEYNMLAFDLPYNSQACNGWKPGCH